MRKGMWFGVFLLLLGASIIVKTFFKIDIPVFRTVLAFFLIYLGVKMLLGKNFFQCKVDKGYHHDNVVSFGERTFKVDATATTSTAADSSSEASASTNKSDEASSAGKAGAQFQGFTKGEKDYSTVFGSSTIDLTEVTLESGKDRNFEVNTVFGETVVLLKKGTAVKIRSSAVFAEARMPNDDIVAFGALNYQEPKEAQSFINIRANVVFGSLKFQFKE